MKGPEGSPYQVRHRYLLGSSQTANDVIYNCRAEYSRSDSLYQQTIPLSRRPSPSLRKYTIPTSPTTTRERCVWVCSSQMNGSRRRSYMPCWSLRDSFLWSRCRMMRWKGGSQSNTVTIGNSTRRSRGIGRGSMLRGMEGKGNRCA